MGAARQPRGKFHISEKKVWFITGAGRGLGLDIAKAVRTAGHSVIATGRDPAKVSAAIGHDDDLMAIKLDITRLQVAQELRTQSQPPLPSSAGLTFSSTMPATFTPASLRNSVPCRSEPLRAWLYRSANTS